MQVVGLIKLVVGQRVITGDNIKIKDCSKYNHKYLTITNTFLLKIYDA